MTDANREIELLASKVLMRLRSGDGLDTGLLGDLKRAIQDASTRWSVSDSVPRREVAILVALVPDLDAASYAYPETKGEAIREHARDLSEAILAAVAETR